MKQIHTWLTGFLLTALSMNGLAQNGSVSGTVTDALGKGLESATLSLLRAGDSVMIKQKASLVGGKFTFTALPYGQYRVTATAVGYAPTYSPVTTLSADQLVVVLPALKLESKAMALNTVTVTAKKPLVEQKIDRTIVNVEAAVTNAGATALEVLEKSPGVTVDKDGNISLKGKEGVMVMVDGRPTQLGAADLANLLRNMTASQLDQIEIMTNPPAKYDAAGNAGIINIKTKKNKQFGYNGSVSLGYGQGRYPKFNDAVSFNYRQGKINLFTNFSHNYRKNFQRLDIHRNARSEDGTLLSSIDQDAHFNNTGNSFNAKAGLDYSVNKNTTVGIVIGGVSGPGRDMNQNNSRSYNAAGIATGFSTSQGFGENTFRNLNSNLNFRQTYKGGKELTADLDYSTYQARENQSLFNHYFNNLGSKRAASDTLYSRMPQDINIYTARMDYLQPLKGDARFEAGVKIGQVKTDNDASYDTTRNGIRIRDNNRSNHFVYEEAIRAAYLNYSRPLGKKWSSQFGLRAEQTRSTGHQLTTKQKSDTTYTQLFPTAFVQYKANEKNTFGVNFGRRIRRPNYESLNPFIEYIDPYTYQAGNPYLKPQFSNNVELSHTYRNMLTTTANYTRTTNMLQQIVEQRGDTAYVKQSNIASQRQVGLSLNANTPVTKWWTSSIYVNGSYNRFEGVVNNQPVTVKAAGAMVNATQQFKFAKVWSAEVSGFYRTAGVEGLIKTKPVGVMNLGLSKQLWNNKGTLRLNVRDVLYTQKFKAETRYANVDAGFQEWRDSRVVNLGFSYRFSKGKMNNTQKRRTAGGNEEQSRVGGGN